MIGYWYFRDIGSLRIVIPIKNHSCMRYVKVKSLHSLIFYKNIDLTLIVLIIKKNKKKGGLVRLSFLQFYRT